VPVEAGVVLIDETLVQESRGEGGSAFPLATPGRTFEQLKSDEAADGGSEEHRI